MISRQGAGTAPIPPLVFIKGEMPMTTSFFDPHFPPEPKRHENASRLFCILVFQSMSVICRTAEVHVDERTIPLLFSQDVSTSFDTNRVARELSRYFSVGLGTERLFCLDEETETQAAPLRPVCPLVPPMSIASDIGIFTNAPERIVVGNIALSALLEAMDAACHPIGQDSSTVP